MSGDCYLAPGFEAVGDAFAANFAAGLDVGASFAVVRDGRLVVDLWGGHADKARSRPVVRDTLMNVWSVSKGVTATCIALLVERGSSTTRRKSPAIGLSSARTARIG